MTITLFLLLTLGPVSWAVGFDNYIAPRLPQVRPFVCPFCMTFWFAVFAAGMVLALPDAAKAERITLLLFAPAISALVTVLLSSTWAPFLFRSQTLPPEIPAAESSKPSTSKA